MQEAAAPAWRSSQCGSGANSLAQAGRAGLGVFGLVCVEWACPCVHETMKLHALCQVCLSSSAGMSLGTLCVHSENCCVPRLSAVSFALGGAYCHQTCLTLGKYFKCVITEIGSRLQFCAVQMIDVLIEED